MPEGHGNPEAVETPEHLDAAAHILGVMGIGDPGALPEPGDLAAGIRLNGKELIGNVKVPDLPVDRGLMGPAYIFPGILSGLPQDTVFTPALEPERFVCDAALNGREHRKTP